MLRNLLLIVVPFLLSFVIEDNLIEWNASRKLTWADFQGKPDPSSDNAALTNSNINVEFGFTDKMFTHSIRCSFNKDKSWVKLKNDHILNHEQGHFDITEVYARILHKELSAYVFNSKTVNKDINDIYSKVMTQHVTVQHNYDLETNHSIDTAKQRLWDNKIASLLKQYEQYANYK